MSREEPAQGGPRQDLDWEHFPEHPIAAGEETFRAHSAGRGPWYFDPGLEGRFNLPAPHGTCYAADTVEIAMRERFGSRASQRGWVTTTLASQAEVSILEAELSRRLALVSTPGAARFGVTTELTDSCPYTLSQEWARHFESHGFDGIRYTSRFSGGGPANAWALFGEAGEHAEGHRHWMDGAEACAAAHIEVRDDTVPARSDVTILSRPPLPSPADDEA